MTTSTTKAIATRKYEQCDIEKVVDRLEAKGNFGEAQFAVWMKLEYLKKCYQDELEDIYGGMADHFLRRIEWCEGKLQELRFKVAA